MFLGRLWSFVQFIPRTEEREIKITSEWDGRHSVCNEELRSSAPEYGSINSYVKRSLSRPKSMWKHCTCLK